MCFADSSKILFNTQGASVQSAMLPRLQNNIYFLSAKQQMRLTKRSKYCVPNGQGNLPPLELQGIVEILKAKPLYQAIYISIFGSIWRETNKCIFEKKEALSSIYLRCLLKDSIARIVRIHFSKFRYAMAKAKKEDDQEKIKKNSSKIGLTITLSLSNHQYRSKLKPRNQENHI